MMKLDSFLKDRKIGRAMKQIVPINASNQNFVPYAIAAQNNTMYRSV